MDRMMVILLFLSLIPAIFALNNDKFKSKENFADRIEVKELMKHLEKFQEIAYEHYGSRNALTGFNATADWIVNRLKEHTDLVISRQQWTVMGSFYKLLPPILTDLSSGVLFKNNIDYYVLPYTISGNVSETITGSNNLIEGGCTVESYANFKSGTIAAITANNFTDCLCEEKLTMAMKFGASAVLFLTDSTKNIYQSLFPVQPILAFIAYPVASQYIFNALQNPTGFNLYMNATVAGPEIVLQNIIAETPDGDENNTLVFGQHLDSVLSGPGINDDGTGSALGLELAIQLYKSKLAIKNKIRFIWFGGEELGLVGSNYYVEQLSQKQASQIALMVDNDMIASPNYVWFMYDGRTEFDPVKKGCTQITKEFETYFNSTSTPYEYVRFDGRSDYQPFINVGIPAGGLFTGAEKRKTEKQAKIFGGTVGEAFDQCYHQKCDTVDNIDQNAYKVTAKATASVLETFATMENIREYLNQ